MKNLTLVCYKEFVNRWGCSWIGLVHNKEPPTEKTNRPKFAFQTALHNTIMTFAIIEYCKDRLFFSQTMPEVNN